LGFQKNLKYGQTPANKKGSKLMKNLTKKAISTFLAITFIATTGLTALAASFTDVPASHWANAAVERAYANGLVKGVGNGAYQPDRSVSNAEWCQMLVNMFFADVEVAPYMSDIAWWVHPVKYTADLAFLTDTTLLDTGLTAKVPWFDSKIVNADINRYDMAQVIYNIANNSMATTPYLAINAVSTAGISERIADYRSVPTKYRTAVEYCYAAGFITGTDANGTFGGSNAMTRGAAATVLTRLLDAKNGAWKIPTFESKPVTPVTPTVKNTAVKDMIKITAMPGNGKDFSIAVNNTTTPGKLSNGKDITPENIAAMLKEIEAIFPNGTEWGANGRATTDSKKEIKYGDYYSYSHKTLGLGAGCNSWAYMTSDILFGNGAKLTAYKNTTDAKPGDAIHLLNKATGSEHWVIVMSAERVESYKLVDGKAVPNGYETQFTICDANAGNPGTVRWRSNYGETLIKNGYPDFTVYSAY
jgi:hypothetical protein